MPPLRSLLIDLSVGVSLAIALMVTIALDRSPSGPGNSPDPTPTVKEEPPPPPRPLLLAVTPPKYDDMGSLLRKLGEGGKGYNFDEIPLDALEDASRIAKYDVLFFTCGPSPPNWFENEKMGNAGRPGVTLARINERVYDQVRKSLRGFVEKGGTLYASDWRFLDLRLCFPEVVGDDEVAEGDKQTLTADVVEPALISRLGSTVDLNFDLGGWYPARIAAREATVYLRGTYSAGNGSRRISSPLLVKVPFGEGTIILTSFHNEKINNDVETKLLEFLVFESVLARESAKARKVIVQGGLSPQKTDILNASSGGAPSALVYRNDRKGRLVFALGFNNEGALLRLTVKGPGGESFQKEGSASFSVDVPTAAVGDWTYTITPLKVPYAKFPYSLTVGGE